MHAIFFNSRGETVQVPIPHSKTVTGKLYRRLAMKKFESYVKKFRPEALSSKPYPFTGQCASTYLKRNTLFLGEERLDNPPAPTLSIRFSRMLLCLASTSEKKLEGWRYHSRQAVEAAVFQCLKSVPKKDYAEAFHK